MFKVTVNGWHEAEFETQEFALIFVKAAMDNDASEIRIERQS